jgi:hypothetical protein
MCDLMISSKQLEGLVGACKLHVGRFWNIEPIGSCERTVPLTGANVVCQHYTTMRNFSLSSPTMLSFCASSSSTSHLQFMKRPEAHGLGSLENQTQIAPQSVMSSTRTRSPKSALLFQRLTVRTDNQHTSFQSIRYKLCAVAHYSAWV